MAERQSLESYITQAEQAVEYAKEQLDLGMRQEHYNTMEYSDAQLQLEQAYNDLQTEKYKSLRGEKHGYRRTEK